MVEGDNGLDGLCAFQRGDVSAGGSIRVFIGSMRGRECSWCPLLDGCPFLEDV